MNRVSKYLLFNFVLALIPLMISLSIRWFIGEPTSSSVYAPELFFVTVMLCATSIGDIITEGSKIKNDIGYWIQLYIIFILFILSIVYYGVYVYDSISETNNESLKSKVIFVSIGFTIVVFICSVSIQIRIDKSKKRRKKVNV